VLTLGVATWQGVSFASSENLRPADSLNLSKEGRQEKKKNSALGRKTNASIPLKRNDAHFPKGNSEVET
jgi:hypothetical protein